MIDFQTGDMGGFKIHNKKCDELFCIYNHEEKKLWKVKNAISFRHW